MGSCAGKDIAALAAAVVDVADAAEYLLTHRSDAVCDEIRLHRVTKAPF